MHLGEAFLMNTHSVFWVFSLWRNKKKIFIGIPMLSRVMCGLVDKTLGWPPQEAKAIPLFTKVCQTRIALFSCFPHYIA